MKGYRLSKLKCIDSVYYPNRNGAGYPAVRSGWNIEQIAVNTFDRNGKSKFGAGLSANLFFEPCCWGSSLQNKIDNPMFDIKSSWRVWLKY